MKEKTDIIVQIMSEKYQTDISVFDDSFLTKTIFNRMKEVSAKGISDYRTYLEQNPSEPELLSGSLNNSYSEFFRNPLTFAILEQMIIPQIMDKNRAGKSGEVRIWSAGCASGQEPYSLAILAEDFREVNKQDISIRIFGTDKSQKELSRATEGIYHFRALLNARLHHLNKYFSNSGEFYSIKPCIKKTVDYSVFDLLGAGFSAPPSSIYGDFDLVMCCNLLFYYKPEIQKKIMTGLLNSLVPGGFLITGEAEIGTIKSFKGLRQFTSPAPIFVKT